MKHFNKILIAVMMVMGLNSHAQDSNNPWAVSLEQMHRRTSAGGGNGWLDQHFLNLRYKRQLECSSICILHQCVKIYRDNSLWCSRIFKQN
jgi:hypothetical protein